MKILKAAGLMLIGLLVGLVIGLRGGQEAAFIIDGVPRAMISTAYLTQMEKGRDKYIQTALEDDVDQGLYYYSLLPNQWWYSAYKMHILQSAFESDMHQYIVAAAKYRQAHPRKVDPGFFDVVPPGADKNLYAELARQDRDRIRRIDDVVKTYGSM